MNDKSESVLVSILIILTFVFGIIFGIKFTGTDKEIHYLTVPVVKSCPSIKIS